MRHALSTFNVVGGQPTSSCAQKQPADYVRAKLAEWA
jgi:hypothetical protein